MERHLWRNKKICCQGKINLNEIFLEEGNNTCNYIWEENFPYTPTIIPSHLQMILNFTFFIILLYPYKKIYEHKNF
jgi:hypothetical protein